MQSLQLNESGLAVINKYRSKYKFYDSVANEVTRSVQALYECYEHGGKLLVCGNGGSATDADHIVGELVKGFTCKRPLERRFIDGIKVSNPKMDLGFLERAQGSLPAINLGAHIGLLTAVSNDIGADLIFVQGVLGYGKSGDVFLGISTSGNSDNVIKAGLVAKEKGLVTIGLTGRSGGIMASLFDICIRVPADSVADIQDMHTPVYHSICESIERQYWEE